MMFHRAVALGACVLGLSLPASVSASEPATADVASPDIPPALVEEIVAKVNSDIVTKGEIERQRRQIENEVRTEAARNPGKLKDLTSQAAEREKDILRDRIDSLLLAQKGKELNINVDTEVSKYLANLQEESKIA